MVILSVISMGVFMCAYERRRKLVKEKNAISLTNIIISKNTSHKYCRMRKHLSRKLDIFRRIQWKTVNFHEIFSAIILDLVSPL